MAEGIEQWLGGEVDLERLGLPIANEENKRLEVAVEQKEKEIGRLQVQIDEHKDRIQAITDHLRNVRQELQHTQVRMETFFAHKHKTGLQSTLLVRLVNIISYARVPGMKHSE